MKKKKLLIATDTFFPRLDGVVRFLSELIPKLSENYEITVLAPEFKGRMRKINARIIRFPLVNFNFGDTAFSFPELDTIKKEVKKTDIVWVQTIGPIGALAIYYGHKSNKNVVASIHSIDWELASNAVKRFKKITKLITKRFARFIYRKCDLLIMPSEETAFLFKKNRIKTKKSIIYLGTNFNRFKPAEDKNKAKRRIGLSPEDKVIGYCGRIGREKDVITLYRAFAKLRKKYRNMKLLIVGDGVKEIADFLRSRKGVVVTGFKNNVLPYLKAMDIYVLPSLTETTSLSTREAMSVGIPVITTKVGKLKEDIKPMKNGLFFAAKNPVSLRNKIELLLNNKELREMLGANARRTIVKEHSWEKTISEIKKELDELVK